MCTQIDSLGSHWQNYSRWLTIWCRRIHWRMRMMWFYPDNYPPRFQCQIHFHVHCVNALSATRDLWRAPPLRSTNILTTTMDDQNGNQHINRDMARNFCYMHCLWSQTIPLFFLKTGMVFFTFLRHHRSPLLLSLIPWWLLPKESMCKNPVGHLILPASMRNRRTLSCLPRFQVLNWCKEKRTYKSNGLKTVCWNATRPILCTFDQPPILHINTTVTLLNHLFEGG